MKLFNKKPANSRVARRRLSDNTPPQRASSTSVAGDAPDFAYRRNRTLTGSLSSRVASANEKGAELKSPRVQAHDLKRHRRHIGFLLIGSLIVVTGLGLLVWQSITTVALVPAGALEKSVDTKNYLRLIDEYFASHPLERFRFILKTDSLAQYLQDNGAPEIQSIDPHTHYAGFGKSEMTIQFRRPAVSWDAAGAQLYVDTNGSAFSRNYFAEPTVKVVDKSGIATHDNQVVASGRFLAFMGKIIGRMESEGLPVVAITIPANTTRQVELSIQGKAYPVRFSTDRPTGEQAEDAARAVRYLDRQGYTPEYVDVRVSGKAYYR